MSTTVTYKGTEIASVENETKTLKTAGTWVEGDIILTDVTSGGGGSSEPSNDVNFIDYDGTIVKSYTRADFMALNALPDNPHHDGLIAQGWNWTLADAKTQLTEYPHEGLTIGQMYVTDDGKTRLYVHFEEGRTSPYFGIGVNGAVVVDWGDGSEPSTLTGTSLTTAKTAQHEYTAGDYVITVDVTSGTASFFGNSGTYALTKTAASAGNASIVYAASIRKIELGMNVTLGNYAFSNCYSLASITIPSGVASTSIGTGAFSNCYSLASITIQNNVNDIKNNAFSYCYSLICISIPKDMANQSSNLFDSCRALIDVRIPNDATVLEDSAFYNCYSLASITIPSGVTSIGSYTFYNCYGMKHYYIMPTTPPTIQRNTFQNIQSDCVIHVPAESLEAYKTASNWSTHASKMVGE
jgi:hypothetical protein